MYSTFEDTLDPMDEKVLDPQWSDFLTEQLSKLDLQLDLSLPEAPLPLPEPKKQLLRSQSQPVFPKQEQEKPMVRSWTDRMSIYSLLDRPSMEEQRSFSLRLPKRTSPVGTFIKRRPSEIVQQPMKHKESEFEQQKIQQLLTDILFLVHIASKAVPVPPRRSTWHLFSKKQKETSVHQESIRLFEEYKEALMTLDKPQLSHGLWRDLYMDIIVDVPFSKLMTKYSHLS
ncbi:hypothetical protein EDD86DRAFT_214567 [Gorgonomyces haynaldii]|nr:hypothetical protein EDD86DRAFT_214567 [Gorgonomyces haynaldii]